MIPVFYQKVEMPYVFIGMWMNKQTVIYPYCEILFSNKKQWNPAEGNS